MNYIKNYHNIDEYIVECERDKIETELKFQDFINMLNQIKKNPKLIFTDFYNKLNNPIYTIANFTSNVLTDVLIPLIKTIPQFNHVDLRSMGYDELKIKNDGYWYIYVRLRDKTFIHNFIEPQEESYKYDISDNTKLGYCQAIALQKFYELPSLHTWINFMNTRIGRKKWLYDWLLIKRNPTIDQAIKVSIENYQRDKDMIKQRRLEYQDDLNSYLNDKELVENIINYLTDCGYHKAD